MSLFHRISLIGLDLAERVIVKVFDQFRINCADKKTGIREPAGHWFVIAPGVPNDNPMLNHSNSLSNKTGTHLADGYLNHKYIVVERRRDMKKLSKLLSAMLVMALMVSVVPVQAERMKEFKVNVWEMNGLKESEIIKEAGNPTRIWPTDEMGVKTLIYDLNLIYDLDKRDSIMFLVKEDRLISFAYAGCIKNRPYKFQDILDFLADRFGVHPTYETDISFTRVDDWTEFRLNHFMNNIREVVIDYKNDGTGYSAIFFHYNLQIDEDTVQTQKIDNIVTEVTYSPENSPEKNLSYDANWQPL